MKLQQLHEDMQEIEEGMLQRAAAAAALVLGTLSPGSVKLPQPAPPAVTQAIQQLEKQTGASPSELAGDVVQIISARYKVDPDLVQQIVTAAKKYEKPDFPRAHHLLGLIGVESSFNPNAVSKLKRDPAVGLTQIRPGVWDIPKKQLATIDGQVKHAAEILSQYYHRLDQDADAALHAYNVGITNHRRSAKDPSKANPRYVPKVRAEVDRLTNSETRPASTR